MVKEFPSTTPFITTSSTLSNEPSEDPTAVGQPPSGNQQAGNRMLRTMSPASGSTLSPKRLLCQNLTEYINLAFCLEHRTISRLAPTICLRVYTPGLRSATTQLEMVEAPVTVLKLFIMVSTVTSVGTWATPLLLVSLFVHFLLPLFIRK